MNQQRSNDHDKNETKLTNNEFANKTKSSNTFLLLRYPVTFTVAEILKLTCTLSICIMAQWRMDLKMLQVYPD